MAILTVWTNQNNEVVLHQLSDDANDGSATEQINYLKTLDVFSGYNCVSEDYTDVVPETENFLWSWDGTKIISTIPVPKSVTPRQVRLLLLQQGLLSQIETTIASMDQATQITWQYAIEFHRNDPLLNQLAQNIGLTSEQVDQFFIDAAAL